MKPACLALVLFAALPARAEPLRRIAVLVGANRGGVGRAQLRYSYSDAEQMAQVLRQVGQFAPADLRVMQDPEPQAILDELDRDLLALKDSGGESMLVFYYSGHADSQSLYPAGKALPFAQLRQRLESQAATVRIGIIDACSGGGWTGTKGIYASAPFVVDVPMQLTSEGSVLIASSSGVEKAHESDQVYGSFFTHHLVAALRGAADQHGDGVVTLTDAFAYARERTIRDSAAVADPQHPSFSMNLRGRADLPLTRVANATTLMEVSETEGPLQLIHLGSGLVVMEVPAGKRTIKLSVPTGRYLVRRQQSGGNYSREVTVEPDRSVSVDEAQLTLTPFPHDATKGAGEPWPIALNDRPLTLREGMAEVAFGALGSRVIGTAPTVGAGGLISSVSSPELLTTVDASLAYGITNRLTLTMSGVDSVCGGACFRPAGQLALNGLYLLVEGALDVGISSRFGLVEGGGAPLDGSLILRAGRGHFASLQVSGTLEHVFGVAGLTAPAPVTGDVAATLRLQPLERLSFDVGSEIVWGLGHPYILPAVLGATYTWRRQVDLRAQVIINAWSTLDEPQNSLDETQFGLALRWRP
jgi:hypothetical protein